MDLEQRSEVLNYIKENYKSGQRIYSSEVQKKFNLPDILTAYGALEDMRGKGLVKRILVPRCPSCKWVSNKDYEHITELPDGAYECPNCGEKNLDAWLNAIVLYKTL